MSVTHYLPGDAEKNGRLFRAPCGTWIRWEEHQEQPTCSGCQAYLAEEANTATVTPEEKFGESDPSLNVAPSFGANRDRNFEGYRPRGEKR